MNPILSIEHFVPDAEPRVWNDGRVYIYGSYDLSGDVAFCSNEYRVFSSADLVNWTDHGVSFRAEDAYPAGEYPGVVLCAPDCIYHNGLYHMYYCLADRSEGVATSPFPYGPFKNAVPVAGAHGDAIDPAALVDDDGQVYYYWGQFHCRAARLKPSLTAIDPDTLNTHLIDEKSHGFHEGPSIRKRNGIYYLIYTDISSGKATRLSYATSKSPLGPFVKGGVIIDNAGCDIGTWNNHGGMVEFKGQWYIFYHRSSQGCAYNRRACVEPIYFNEDGSIKEVEMTTQGGEGPIPATRKMEAYRACLVSGLSIRTSVAELTCHNNTLSEYLSHIRKGDWAAYKYLDFGEGVSSFEARVASLAEGGAIELRLDRPDGPIIGSCKVKHTGGWQLWETVTCTIQPTTGVHALYLVFQPTQARGRNRLLSVESFQFRK